MLVTDFDQNRSIVFIDRFIIFFLFCFIYSLFLIILLFIFWFVNKLEIYLNSIDNLLSLRKFENERKIYLRKGKKFCGANTKKYSPIWALCKKYENYQFDTVCNFSAVIFSKMRVIISSNDKTMWCHNLWVEIIHRQINYLHFGSVCKVLGKSAWQSRP